MRNYIYDIYYNTTDTGEKIIVKMQKKSQLHKKTCFILSVQYNHPEDVFNALIKKRALFYLSNTIAQQGKAKPEQNGSLI